LKDNEVDGYYYKAFSRGVLYHVILHKNFDISWFRILSDV